MLTPKPCRHCKAPVLIVARAQGRSSGGRYAWDILDADALDPNRQHDGRRVRVIDADRSYTLGHAREHLSLTASVLTRPGDATDINDLPWHRLHDCPNRPERTR